MRGVGARALPGAVRPHGHRERAVLVRLGLPLHPPLRRRGHAAQDPRDAVQRGDARGAPGGRGRRVDPRVLRRAARGRQRRGEGPRPLRRYIVMFLR